MNEEGKINNKIKNAWKEKKKDKVHCSSYKYMSFSVTFKLRGSRPIEFIQLQEKKKMKSFDKAHKFNCTYWYRLLLC